jgi:hypothetical protein
MDKLQNFEIIHGLSGRFRVKGVQFNGWEIGATAFLKSVKLTGSSPDGAPIFELTWDIHSTPIPPVKKGDYR